jgi:hypothetical protein
MKMLSHIAPLFTIIVLGLDAAADGLAAGEPTAQGESPYKNDPAIVKMLEFLGDRSSLALPPVTINAARNIFGSEIGGPPTRGFTLKMVYAPERQTALYEGGDHQCLRSSDVWEYHLGSNSWNMIFEPDGGNQADMKGTLMFTARKLREKPDYRMNDSEKKNWDETKKWWKQNVVLRDGVLVTSHGGPLLVGHTWDTLVYDPAVRRMIHGTGAYCSDAVVLHSRFEGIPLADAEKGLDKSCTGIWTFDPGKKMWACHRHDPSKPMAPMGGMGATMCYIPDWGKVLWYTAAQNVSPHAYEMWAWDVAKDEWTELKPNGGRRISDLVLRDKVAPSDEMQTAYSPKHKKLVAVRGPDTFVYDILRNEWTKACTDNRIEAFDYRTVFAYDSHADVFLLSNMKKTLLAAFSLDTGKWEEIVPNGPGLRDRPDDRNVKGYYDPKHNVFVLHGSWVKQVWVYRHTASK